MLALLTLFALPLLAQASSIGRGETSRHCKDKFYRGHDLSSLLTLEETGDFSFVDTAHSNSTRPADDILADGGMNAVRLRIWVDPEGGTNGLEYTTTLAKRFQAKGHRLYLDFHFADSWADPNKQPTPAAWQAAAAKGVEELAKTLRGYVSDTLLAFHKSGVKWDIVSLGNEIRHGMLWPTGYVDVDTEPKHALNQNFTNLAKLYNAARLGLEDAVHEGVKKPDVMIHIDDGWNCTLQERWFDALTAAGVRTSSWDVFGFSFYPFYGTSATFDNLKETLHKLAEKYMKPLHVAETDYPAVCNGEYNPIPPSSEPGIPYSTAGQTDWVKEVIRVVQKVPFGLGAGVWYWEPAWLNNTSLGSNCSDAILFEADYSAFPETVGYSRTSVNFFK